MPLQMGSARIEITPRAPAHLAGYGSRDHPHEAVHDPLWLRALYVRGAGGDAVLLSADLLWFGEQAHAAIRSLLCAELRLEPARVFLAGTHTHSGPVVSGEHVDREWLGALEGRTLAAAAMAQSRLQPVRLRAARGACGIGLNRRERQPDGSIRLGHDPDGPADHELIAILADDESGAPVARLLNYACHGVVLGPRNYRISGDWPGWAAGVIEQRIEGPAALFFNGGGGNVDPRVRVQTKFEPVRELACEFVAAFDAACRDARPLAGEDTVAGVEHVVHLPRKQCAIEDGQGRTRRVTLHGLRLGPLRLAGYPGEMFSETAMAVKSGSPHPCTFAVSYAGSGHAGYVPVKAAYESGGYEVRVSPYSEEAEAILRQELLDLLKRC